jgi:hypothetical protein
MLRSDISGLMVRAGIFFHSILIAIPLSLWIAEGDISSCDQYGYASFIPLEIQASPFIPHPHP